MRKEYSEPDSSDLQCFESGHRTKPGDPLFHSSGFFGPQLQKRLQKPSAADFRFLRRHRHDPWHICAFHPVRLFVFAAHRILQGSGCSSAEEQIFSGQAKRLPFGSDRADLPGSAALPWHLIHRADSVQVWTSRISGPFHRL